MVDFTVPDRNIDEKDVLTQRSCNIAEEFLYQHVSKLRSQLISHYDIEYHATEQMSFLWYPQGASGKFECENSEYVRKSWLRVRNRDLTGILFLSDYQSKTPFDGEYEVYGGKVEFPQWKFGFNPTRGTLVVYPSGPHFINVVSPILAGDLFMVKFHIAAKTPLMFDPKKFPGDYKSWFKHLL